MSKRPVTPKGKPRKPAPSQISEAELQRRLAARRVRVGFRIAGPDSSIYRGGLQMTSIRRVQPGPSQADEP